MLLARIAEASAALSATPSRNGKRSVLAELMSEVVTEADPTQAAVVTAWLSGGLRQRRTGIGWASLAQVPPPAPRPTLTVPETDAVFAAVAELGGDGSATARSEAVRGLFGRATTAEQRLLVGLVSGELRHGALESLVQEGLAAALGLPVTEVRRAAMLLGSTPRTAELAISDGPAALAEVGLQVGTPVQPMLAASAPSVADAVAKVGLPVLVDHKLDGIRVQVHRRGDDVRVFTRSLDDITSRLPEVVAAARALPHSSFVLDGEALAVREDGRPEKFQVIASRTASTDDAARTRLPLRAFYFDLLELDGTDLLATPLRERVQIMDRVLPADQLVPRRTATDVAEVTAAFTAAVDGGFEGVVIKDLDAGYAAGRRAATWTKIKPRHTLDLVVLAAEWGHGRRQGLLSNLHLGAPDGEGFVMLGKTFKGLTDELLAWQTAQLLARETRRTRGTVFVRPELVVEIAVDGVQDSTRYPGRIALRFARVVRYRPDKAPEQASTLDEVRALG